MFRIALPCLVLIAAASGASAAVPPMGAVSGLGGVVGVIVGEQPRGYGEGFRGQGFRGQGRGQIRMPFGGMQREQDRAFQATSEGRAVPLPVIERRVVPMMNGADYLGPELRGSIYRLKFLQDGRVVWVDVDAATGRVLRSSGR